MPGIFKNFFENSRQQSAEKVPTIDPNYSFYTGHLVDLPMPKILDHLEKVDESKIQLQQPFFDDVDDAKHIYFYDGSVGIRFWDLYDNRNPTARIEIKGRGWWHEEEDEIPQSEKPDLYDRVSALFDKYCGLYQKNIGMDYSGMGWLQLGYTLSGMLPWLDIQPEILEKPGGGIIAVSFVIDKKFRLSYDTSNDEYGLKILGKLYNDKYRIQPNDPRFAQVADELSNLADSRFYDVAKNGPCFSELFKKVISRVLTDENKKGFVGLDKLLAVNNMLNIQQIQQKSLPARN